jgi:hypothetical protein
MPTQFEVAGNMADWPRNEPDKPTQAAVFGVKQTGSGNLRYEIFWTAKFPVLDKALYWAAKKEVEIVRKGKWPMASRVVWQHDLTPEQAVAVAFAQMSNQIKQALNSAERGDETLELGCGPMRQVGPADGTGVYVEVSSKDDPSQPPLASWIVEPPGVQDLLDAQKPINWIPNDPRRDKSS